MKKVIAVTSKQAHSTTPWKLERPDYDPDERALELRQRFAKISNGSIASECSSSWWKVFGKPLIVGAVLGIICGSLFFLSPWPPLLTIKHIASAPNCDAARALGLAPSFVGQPGYWDKHDRDDDGIACEPYFQGRSHQPVIDIPQVSDQTLHW